jgi:hypothetical protein
VDPTNWHQFTSLDQTNFQKFILRAITNKNSGTIQSIKNDEALKQVRRFRIQAITNENAGTIQRIKNDEALKQLRRFRIQA